ncbi:MAG: DUF1553 domain-containing protein [Verrucomicrobiales bacterium]|nr:DUF1553 domain-containing protein [Verrucomicrobiales bacterium]
MRPFYIILALFVATPCVAADPPSFRNHVLPIISKQGCNSGGCHGALAGKGGFRLSLGAYNPEADYHTITKEARGRRIEPSDPGRSLLLTKATTALKHTGGKRIAPGSADYRVIADWIAAGSPPPSDSDPVLASLEVTPPLTTLAPGATQQITVHAKYSDGTTEDITRWAKFTSTDEAIATVDQSGTATVVGHGEGAVTAWFSSQIVIARISSPYPNDIPAEKFANAPRRNFIDDLNLTQLQRLNLPHSPRSADHQFLRRAYIDTIGLPPTAKEAETFLADNSPDKRDQLITTLLARKEFTDYWSYRWSDVFLVSGRKLRPDAVKAYYNWIRKNVADNNPWDDFARQLVTATGSSVTNGATNFYAVHQDPETMAENVSQAFLSLSINCAKCHNHPLEKWTNDQYYAFANLFSRVRAKGWGGDARNGNGHRTVYVAGRGDLIQPRTGKPQPPAPLDAEPIDPDETTDRRQHLAAWLTSPANKLFARSVTNRVWANFFGRGLVDPVDDLRASNPASNQPLLEALANHLVENKYDLKSLMRLILQSETYQRTSTPAPGAEADTQYLSHYQPRRHMAEALHDAVAQVTAVPTDFNAVALNDGSTQKTDFYPSGTRAIQLYDAAVQNYFLETFGRNSRDISCECERSNQPSLVQVLNINNGKTINNKLATPDNNIDTLTKTNTTPESLVKAAYLTTLSRPPTTRESDAFIKILTNTPPEQKRQATEDLLWSLLSSREFLFQH